MSLPNKSTGMSVTSADCKGRMGGRKSSSDDERPRVDFGFFIHSETDQETGKLIDLANRRATSKYKVTRQTADTLIKFARRYSAAKKGESAPRIAMSTSFSSPAGWTPPDRRAVVGQVRRLDVSKKTSVVGHEGDAGIHLQGDLTGRNDVEDYVYRARRDTSISGNQTARVDPDAAKQTLVEDEVKRECTRKYMIDAYDDGDGGPRTSSKIERRRQQLYWRQQGKLDGNKLLRKFGIRQTLRYDGDEEGEDAVPRGATTPRISDPIEEFDHPDERISDYDDVVRPNKRGRFVADNSDTCDY